MENMYDQWINIQNGIIHSECLLTTVLGNVDLLTLDDVPDLNQSS